MVIEVGYLKSLKELQEDAAWWLINLKALTKMMNLIKIGKNLLSLNLEYWKPRYHKRGC